MISDAVTALKTLLGDRLSQSPSDLNLHGQSESHFATTPPDAVAYPGSTQEVQAIVTICQQHSCPMIGWGTGTSLEGHTLAVRGGISVDFSRMSNVLKISPEDMTVRIQPGVTREALNEELRATGLFFPVDPGANASLGGMAATRASGTTAVRYGTMRDNVLGLEVVMADGEIVRTGTEARKTSSGYDLTGLFVGSEGTLGLITELTLRLQGQPEAVSAGVCSFDTIHQAVAAVIDTIQMGIPMARIEFIDAETVAAVNTYSNAGLPLLPHLLVEFHGSEAAVAQQSETFSMIISEHDGHDFKWATKTEDRSALWKMRHTAYYAVLASRTGARAVVTDICVPISKLAVAVEQTSREIADSAISGPIMGHVGDGNFHAILMIDPDSPDELKTAKALSEKMIERALDMGGTATGEHGIGIGKLDYMTREHGQGWAVMGSIKRALDPQDLMNPGKLVRQN